MATRRPRPIKTIIRHTSRPGRVYSDVYSDVDSDVRTIARTLVGARGRCPARRREPCRPRTASATPGKAPRLPKAVATAVEAARDKKAFDTVVLDLRKADGFTDYFVICTGANPRQITAIADAVRDA